MWCGNGEGLVEGGRRSCKDVAGWGGGMYIQVSVHQHICVMGRERERGPMHKV